MATALRIVIRTAERVSHSGWKFGILSFEKVMGVSRSSVAISRCERYLLKNSLCKKSLPAGVGGKAQQSILSVNNGCSGYIVSPSVNHTIAVQVHGNDAAHVKLIWDI